MFRKFLIAAALTLALLAPFALPNSADALGPHGARHTAARHYGHRHGGYRYGGHRHGYPWRVYYRTGVSGPWLVTGNYGCRADALRAAAGMPGCQTFVR